MDDDVKENPINDEKILEETIASEPNQEVDDIQQSKKESETSNALNIVDLEPKWYVLHTYSGYESMVEQNIRKMVETNNIQNMIVDISIPVESDIVEKPNGKKKVVEKKKFPGYVFIKMIHTKQMWYMVTSTRGVTGFVGPSSRAIPLTKDEVKRMALEKIKPDVDLIYNIGDTVEVVSGALEGFTGKIASILQDKKKAKVSVSMFGRDTIVDLGFEQIDKVFH